MITRYFVSFNTITTIDMSENPDYIEITEAEYMWLSNGMNNGFQVWINNGVPSLRTPPPFGQNPDDYDYDVETDFWKRKEPSDYNGYNYYYDELYNLWFPTPVPDIPNDFNGINYYYDDFKMIWVSVPPPPEDYDGYNYVYDRVTETWVKVNPPDPE